jgi:para-nitrobenzyl esterase
MQLVVVCLVLAFALWNVEATRNQSIYAWTKQGIVRGYSTKPDGAQVFLGIPFAAPTERFKPPQNPRFRFHVFDATKFGSPCPQLLEGVVYTDLDCLNLNIYAPHRARAGDNLPVLVYWYGGAFLYYSNALPESQAETLANEGNVIIVSPNYRLGALGFLYVNQLQEADAYKNNKVNFAMLDMIKALEWVKDNIWFFGGDPCKVTAGGHSSGAFMASWLTIIPASWPLFKQVLQFEGPLSALDDATVLSESQGNENGQQFAQAVGCTQTDPNQFMECLATVDIVTLVNGWQSFTLLPVVDGVLFPYSVQEAMTDSSLNAIKPVPNFMMATPNPGTLFADNYLPIIETVGWENFILGTFPDIGQFIVELYDVSYYGVPGSFLSNFLKASYFISDSVWLCPLRRHANTLQSFVTSDVYVTVWNVSGSQNTFPPYFGVVHGAMLPFVFGNAVDIATQIPGTFTPEEARLSKKIIKTVSEFLRTGKPGFPYPVWNLGNETNSVIDLNFVHVTAPLEIIRFPPPGALTPPIGVDGTRCGFYDYLFYFTKKDIDWSKLAGKKANFLPNKKKLIN